MVCVWQPALAFPPNHPRVSGQLPERHPALLPSARTRAPKAETSFSISAAPSSSRSNHCPSRVNRCVIPLNRLFSELQSHLDSVKVQNDVKPVGLLLARREMSGPDLCAPRASRAQPPYQSGEIHRSHIYIMGRWAMSRPDARHKSRTAGLAGLRPI
jgi:hypothetical protein